MKVGLVGSGGREHAIAKTLMREPARDSLWVYASHLNPGFEALAAECKTGRITDISGMNEYFQRVGTDFVVIGPETPLMEGVVDSLRSVGIPTVGPTRTQARIEGDKSFMRWLLRERVGWGSPGWQLVTSRQEAAEFISMAGEIVIKPVGLTGGKGVQVMGVHTSTVAETLDEIDIWLEQDGRVLLEEKLVGEEFSRMAFISDNVIVPMPVCQDFKYAYDGDQGGMTGGMGSYSMLNGSMPFIKERDLEDADRLMAETVKALFNETGQAYCGFLYGQFMASADGIRVIEFNARLGDPEAINVMSLLEGDAALLFASLANGELDERQVGFKSQASLCKYLVPEGYPVDSGDPLIFSLEKDAIVDDGFSVIYASVERLGDRFRTLGSRTLAIVGLGASPGEISRRMEGLMEVIEPDGLRHRRDVGDTQVIQNKVQRMGVIRGEAAV